MKKELLKKLKDCAKWKIVNGEYFDENHLYDYEAKEILNEIKRLNNIVKKLDREVIDIRIGEYGDTFKEAKKYLQQLKENK